MAAMIINPNFTQRRSFYLKKFNIAMWTTIGVAWGTKRENDTLIRMMLRQYDYFPLEVKRTLQTKDHRHMVGFDYKNPNRKLFDDRTGKSLS